MGKLKSSVTTTLSDLYVARMKPIIYRCYSIKPIDYHKIAGLVNVGIIKVYKINTKKNPELTSAYIPHRNHFEFTFSKATNAFEKAIIVHEATHAIMDLNKSVVLIKYAEAIAYIAQWQYKLLADPSGDPLQGSGVSNKKFVKAKELAEKLLWGRGVYYRDIEELAAIIQVDPNYSQSACVKANYQGMAN